MKFRNINSVSVSSFIKWRKLFFISFFIFSFLHISGCKKESDLIGLELQPESEILNAFSVDTFSIITYPVHEDSIRTDSRVMLFNNLIGSYVDPVFGRTTASFYSQFRLTSSNVNFGTAPQLDSIVLSLAYAGFYGDTTTTQTISVYKMTESIHADTNYYSTDQFNVEATPVGTITFQPQPNTPVVVGNETVAPQIRIKLENSFGNEILNAGAGNLTNNDAWLQFLPGLYIKADDVAANGAIYYINYASSQSKLSLYYSDTISHHYPFVISAAAARVNHYDHEYNMSQIAFNDSIQGGITSYIQSMAGVKTRVKIPHLQNLSDQGPVAINRAQLIVKVVSGTTDIFAPNDKLVLFAADSAGGNVILPDQLLSVTSSFFGGDFNTVTREYVFNIPRYAQQIINERRENYGLYLLPSTAASNANRTIIGGGSALSPAQMKLKILYTRIQ